MKIELKYFTGTGNSLKILDTCKEVFVGLNHEKVILDSMDYVHNGKNIVLPVTVNGVDGNFIFDTGADINSFVDLLIC